MAASELAIVIRAKNEAARVFEQARRQAADLDDNLRRLTRAGFLGLAAGGAVAGAALLKFGKMAAAEQAGIARLQTSIRTLDREQQAMAAGVEAVINARERLAFSDDAQRESLSLLIAQTGSYEAALERSRLAMDVARGTGLDYAIASRLLGKINEETTSTFARYGVVMRQGATETEALAEIQRRFAGQAAAFAETAAGKWEIFRIELDNIQETIGAAVLPAFTSLAGRAGDWLDAHQADIDRVVQDFASRIPDAIDLTTGGLETTFEGAQTAAMGLRSVVGAADDLADAAIPLALALAFLFPGQALVLGILAVHETFTIMENDIDAQSDAALAFQDAWLGAIENVLLELDSLEQGFLDLISLGVLGGVFESGAKRAAEAVAERRRAIIAERHGRQPVGGFPDLETQQSAALRPEDFLRWIEAAEKADDTIRRFTPGLNSVGAAASGAMTKADAAAESLRQLAVLYGQWAQATGGTLPQFIARLEMMQRESELNAQLADAQMRASIEAEKATDANYGLRIALKELALEALNSGRTLNEVSRAAFAKLVDNLRQAFDGLFGRPTREQAQLNLRLALLEEERARMKVAGASEEELERIDKRISRLRDEDDLLSKHADVLRAQLEVADQTLITEEHRDIAAQMFISAMEAQSAQLATLTAMAGLEAIAREHLISAINNQANAYGSAVSAADPFDTLQKAYINAVARGKNEPEPFPGYEHGTSYVRRTGLAVVHEGERITSAADNRRGTTAGGLVNYGTVEIVLPNVREPQDFARELDRYFRQGA
jgi:hypothetical protein